MAERLTILTSQLTENDDTEGHAIVSEVGQPLHGRIVFDGETIVYTAPSLFLQVDEDAFTYTLADDYGQTSTATVRILFDDGGVE